MSDQRHIGSDEIDVTDPKVNEYVFKHLHANTEYSFSVRPRTKVGESAAFSEPVLQFTGPGKQTEINFVNSIVLFVCYNNNDNIIIIIIIKIIIIIIIIITI